ncbi:MAG: thioredoxin family protein, partial [Bacteroidota bacterium]
AKGMTYPDYVDLIDRLLAEGKTTGPDQSPERLEKAKLNRQRMKRLDKTYHPGTELTEVCHALNMTCDMLVLTEGWCGDASQLVPLLHRMAAESGGRIRDCYLLRDEHPELMDLFLTGSRRSIPKAVFVDAQTGRVYGSWGPRPASISKRYAVTREGGTHSKEELHTLLHTWYAEDKGQAFEADMLQLLRAFSGN